ncbi:type III secretion system cytoplasmic ring protein SctQ [Parachitinimonas caeni]|uniref:Type III secretion system cytoplasmic ring protein SctQ n=1 Tax=Parachitinimonas caeni TaxID=3031301 RepID=A0ABT7DTU2_9NEIS|nr:type III secretion system cytoplasmic ring protein SctQ [Parachitinimonas caeni]MDK2123500.1 type III secretion system cytoplasmic ring protein SctQ [Parachitinimonas caeni]
MSSRLVLPKLTREEMAYRNLISLFGAGCRFKLGAGDWRLSLEIAREASGTYWLDTDWGGGRVLLGADTALFGRWLRQILPEAELAVMPEALALAVLEHLLTTLAASFEKAGKRALRLNAAGFEPKPFQGAHHYRFRLESLTNGETIQGTLSFDIVSLSFLAAWLKVGQLDITLQDWDTLSVPLRFEAGWLELKASELQGLAVQDILLPDECLIQRNQATQTLTVRVADRFAFNANLDGSRLTVIEPLRNIMAENPAPTDSESVPLDQLSVRISFDLGERSLTFAELRALQPGRVFDLGRDVRRAVTIRANGRPVGEGELVEVDGRVGVAVLRLNPPAAEHE